MRHTRCERHTPDCKTWRSCLSRRRVNVSNGDIRINGSGEATHMLTTCVCRSHTCKIGHAVIPTCTFDTHFLLFAPSASVFLSLSAGMSGYGITAFGCGSWSTGSWFHLVVAINQINSSASFYINGGEPAPHIGTLSHWNMHGAPSMCQYAWHPTHSHHLRLPSWPSCRLHRQHPQRRRSVGTMERDERSLEGDASKAADHVDEMERKHCLTRLAWTRCVRSVIRSRRAAIGRPKYIRARLGCMRGR